MTSRAFDIPAGSGPAVLYLVRHAVPDPGLSTCPDCPRCLETPVLKVLRLGTTRGTTRGTRGTPLRVVIAEDEALIRLDLKEMLEEEGYEVAGQREDPSGMS
jgi:hypothetical protein